MNGEFLPGQRITVREIAEQFRTSAMPVREAFRQLVSDEALFDHPNRGVIVPDATVTLISDLVRVRCEVEGKAAQWAAATVTAAELFELEALNERMRDSKVSGGLNGYFALNRQFHFAVYRAARSPILQQIIERMWLRAGPWLTIVRSEGTMGLGLHHHEAIIASLQRGDGEGARQALVSDLSDAADIIMRAVANGPPRPVRTPARKREALRRAAER